MSVPDQTYYWSVQSIDQAFVGSEFAGEQSFAILITDLNEFLPEKDFTFYPNPAREKITIQYEDEDKVEFRIFCLNGQEVHTGMVISNGTIDISSLTKGIYFILFDSESGQILHKLIKE